MICGDVSITSPLAVAEVIVLVRMVTGEPFFCIPVPVTVHCTLSLSFFSELAGGVEVVSEVTVCGKITCGVRGSVPLRTDTL